MVVGSYLPNRRIDMPRPDYGGNDVLLAFSLGSTLHILMVAHCRP